MTFTKDPDATLDYAFDWSDWLEDGETIASETVDVQTGITENTSDREVSDSVVKVWLTGGQVGQRYSVACKITTDNTPARVDERTIYIRVAQK